MLSFRPRRERSQAEEGEVAEPAPDLGQLDAQTRRLIRTLTTSADAYVREVEDRLPAIHALHTVIAKRFVEEEIEIAFPQMDIRVRSTTPQLRDDPPRPLRLASPSD